MNLISILVLLFITLFVVVKLTERHGKPLTYEQQSKLSKIAMVLIFVMLVAALIKNLM
ncbi:hypothetical protein [Endozoicomonas sp. SCSIO W0465]|uniref:hypothetical protein n=1 Tax=Endozoicomonas sp. SCSIO W0465 TaxID=2918516 RepID=UPI002075A8F2|nr:hypothetical protein [Endozoicomonas sp. SCSIO W0465]USE34740.1 hypothetical protein MJO57_21795 [Endozoicomonas sp. SCSIO W0465]